MPRDIIPQTKSDVMLKLEAARARIEQGWIQRHPMQLMTNGKYAYCMMGSIYEQGGQRGADRFICDQAIGALAQAVVLLSRNQVSLVSFNDNWGRTKRDVLQAFDLAIELRRKEEYNGQ
jgi:hypothetical protein